VYLVKEAGLGIAGVAVATLIAQGLSAVISLIALLVIVRKYYEDDINEKAPIFSLNESIKMAGIAFPSIIQQATVSIGMMLVQSVVNTFGAQALAGFSAAARVESFIAVPWGAF
ncbi:MAG: MATE family efflux transporter, partial [Bacillota bacterium]|nr:MATE family efflux transporter [Bacillota bacterium]